MTTHQLPILLPMVPPIPIKLCLLQLLLGAHKGWTLFSSSFFCHLNLFFSLTFCSVYFKDKHQLKITECHWSETPSELFFFWNLSISHLQMVQLIMNLKAVCSCPFMPVAVQHLFYVRALVVIDQHPWHLFWMFGFGQLCCTCTTIWAICRLCSIPACADCSHWLCPCAGIFLTLHFS